MSLETYYSGCDISFMFLNVGEESWRDSLEQDIYSHEGCVRTARLHWTPYAGEIDPTDTSHIFLRTELRQTNP